MTESAGSPFSAATIEKEWQFLCLCATPAAKSTDIGRVSFRDLDWTSLLELAHEHRIIGVLARRLQELDFAEVPAASREKLQSRLRAQHLFSLSMTAGLFRIFEEFSRADVDSVLVKGPLVSLLAYGDPAVRCYVDLDLIVRHRQIAAATKIMMDLGYEPDVPVSIIEAGKIPGEYLFHRPGTSQIVELHSERTFRYYPRPLPVEDYLERRRRVMVDGQEIPALCLEDEFVLNCIHGAKHFWERLMWVADIAAIVLRHQEMDWRKLKRFAEDVGGSRMVHLGLKLAESVLKVPIPDEMKEAVAGDKTALTLCKQVVGWLPSAGYDPPLWKERAMFRMRMRGGSIAGASYLLRLALSPTEEDWSEGAEETRPGIWDAVQRPLRLLKKYRIKNG
jgi:Uncharacterised nucleotidyltransferase